MKLDTLGFGDKAVTKLSTWSSCHSSFQGKPGELLLVQLGGCHPSQAGGPGRVCGQTPAPSLGVKGCGGSPGGRGTLILGEHWEAAMCHPPLASGFPQGGGKCLFSNQGLGAVLCEQLLVFLGDQSWSVRPRHRLVLMVLLLGCNKGLSRSGGM